MDELSINCVSVICMFLTFEVAAITVSYNMRVAANSRNYVVLKENQLQKVRNILEKSFFY